MRKAPCSCSTLLDPRSASLPEHICPQTAVASTEFFSKRHLPHRTAANISIPRWPLPVGPDLDGWLRIGELPVSLPSSLEIKFLIRTGPSVDRRLMLPPFISQAGALAGAIFERIVTSGRIFVFGLVSPVGPNEWEFIHAVTLTERRSSYPGTYGDPLDCEATKLVKLYERSLLNKVHRGRPRGSRTMDENDFLQQYPEAYKKAWTKNPNNRRPSQRRTADELLLSEKTLRNFLRLTGTAWPPKTSKIFD